MPILTLEEIAIKLTDPIPAGPPDLIPGFLPKQGQLVLAGETEVGKSLVALEVVSALVTGNPLWGHLHPTQKVKRILYVLGEHYDEVIQRLYQHTKLPMTDQVFLLGPEALKGDKWLVSQGKQNTQAVAKFQVWAKDCDLIVFDPFSSFVLGVDAENDNLQMRLALDTMSLIAQTAGASCLILAHQGKPYFDKAGQERHRSSYAIRGASAIEDAATNIFYMNRSSARSQAGKEASEDGQLFDLVKRKYKGEAPDLYKLKRDTDTLTHTLLTTARPHVDQRRTSIREKIQRYQIAHPTATLSDAVTEIASIEGKDPSTLWRYLE